MNDVCPSLLRLITCPSFVCVYFSFPHLSLLVLFCISSVTNGRPPSFPRPFTRLAVYLYFLCIFFYFSSIFFFTVHFLTGMGSFHSWRIRLQTIVIPFMGYCKKERKRRIRKKIGKIKRDTEMRKNRKEKRRWNLDADWARDGSDELSFAIVVIQLRWWRTRHPFYRHYQYLSASSFSRRGAKMCWLPSYWLYSLATVYFRTRSALQS